MKKSENNLKDLHYALSESNKYGEHGYKLGIEAITLLKRTVNSVSMNLQTQIEDLEKNKYNNQEVLNNLSLQLAYIKENYKKIPSQLKSDLKLISKSSFSITLFGRTMAGKSTLMEILTNGNGSSIGIGAQRTTRDVRTYKYKGMTVTDVPGIAAFEGADDEEVAFESAKKSDLILFLMTDDAPQESEADALNKIMQLGKPVICIINVKVNIESDSNLKLFQRDIQKKMKMDRLQSIRKQFIKFGKQYGQDWNQIRFVYLHLKSAYLSQQQSEKNKAEELYKLSRFSYLEDLMIDEVIKNGKFYKLKSFIDTVTVPNVSAIETLFEQSAQNSQQGRVLIGKRRQLKKWTDDFEVSAEDRIDFFLERVSGEIRKEVTSFSEDNYNNPRASSAWRDIIKNYQIEVQAKSLFEDFAMECEKETQEIVRQIHSELKFNHAIFSDNSINMSRLGNGKRIWNWTTVLVSGGLTITGLFVSGPIGLIGIAVGVVGSLGSFLFGDQEKKAYDARKKLENKLLMNLDRMVENLRENMLNVLQKELLEKQLYALIKTIDDIIDSSFILSKTQQDFAKKINTKLQEMNKTILTEALAYTGYTGLEWHVSNIVRIPGNSMMLVLEDGTKFPNDAHKSLSHLLKEKVWFVFNTNNLESMLLQAIGKARDRKSVRIEYINDEPRIAHITNINELDPQSLNRIRLAQQLTELLIMK